VSTATLTSPGAAPPARGRRPSSEESHERHGDQPPCAGRSGSGSTSGGSADDRVEGRISDRTYILRNGRNELDRPSAELLDSDELVSSYLR
jgi:hypothetical protein